MARAGGQGPADSTFSLLPGLALSPSPPRSLTPDSCRWWAPAHPVPCRDHTADHRPARASLFRQLTRVLLPVLMAATRRHR